MNKNLLITGGSTRIGKEIALHFSRKVLKMFSNGKKKLVIVKNGDHSLSSQKWLNLLKKELKIIIS